MPDIDITITISVIVTLCAIISPIATAIINNHYQLRLKKMDLEQKNIENTVLYKRAVFENYLKYASRCISYSDDLALKEYGEYYLLAMLYSPYEFHSDMIQIHKNMHEYKWNDAAHLFERLVPRLQDLIKKL